MDASWLRLAASPPVVRRALGCAVVVGAVLIAINHGDAILAGEIEPGRLAKMGLTTLVPYCVSTLSSVGDATGRAGARGGRSEPRMSEQPKTAEGGCYCAAVRFRVTFPSRFCAHCHCPNCRRAHGAAFVTYVGFRREQLEFLAGEETLGRYVTETGATRSFCTTCGTTLFYEGPRWENEIHVTRSSIEGDVDREPDAHVYVDHVAPWFRITDDLKRYGGKTGVEPESD